MCSPVLKPAMIGSTMRAAPSTANFRPGDQDLNTHSLVVSCVSNETDQHCPGGGVGGGGLEGHGLEAPPCLGASRLAGTCAPQRTDGLARAGRQNQMDRRPYRDGPPPDSNVKQLVVS